MIENTVNTWAEAISSLPDKQFFNFIRLYLGEVKTPYNKQKLTSQLATVLKSPENLSAVATLLDEFDIHVLTAISLIPNSNKKILVEFFSGKYTFSEIFAELVNLTDRMIIYTAKDPLSEKESFLINPLFEETIKPYLSVNYILDVPSPAFFSTDDIFSLSPDFLAAFTSFAKMTKISCKNDGSIKKNDMAKLSEIFPGKEKCLQLLVNAFINLSIFREGEKYLQIDNSRLNNFAKLSETQQYALLCAASTSRFSRDGLRKEAQLLLDCISSIPESGYTRNTILRLAFLVGTYSEDGSAIAKKSRFSQILAAAKQSENPEVVQNADLLDRMIDSAIEFGLLQKTSQTETGEGIFIKGSIFQDSSDFDTLLNKEEPKVLNIESTFSITIMPGLSLSALLPFTNFLSVKKTGVVNEFEINRSNISYAFDSGWTPDSIFKTLEKYSYYEIPQNMKINIQEWYTSYSSAMLYHGYVLKVTDSNIQFAENNPNIKNFIKEKLADGIYLLNFPATADISDFISKCGLDFMGTIKSSTPENIEASFPALSRGKKISISKLNNANPEKISIAKANQIITALKDKVDSMDLTQNQKDSFINRISLRTILTESQLKTSSIKNEILEADGMDFIGKVHLLEAAFKEEDMVELQFPSPEGKGGYFTIVGKILQLSKQNNEAVIRFQIEPSNEINSFLVSQITHLRRLRF
ncbi:MAG: helicase-associated domain-containing protein [Spirochaetia bacterium]|nr:helicase-associated domain-containing protein [Spirochaetia bacterium]